MSSPTDDSKGRWGRRGRSRDRRTSVGSGSSGAYVAPTPAAPADFVTVPPIQRGLTTGISTLFRRAGSRGDMPAVSGSTAGDDANTASPRSRSRSRAGGSGSGQGQVNTDADDTSKLDQYVREYKAATDGATNLGKASVTTHVMRTPSRIFSNADDSDDSYESRMSRNSQSVRMRNRANVDHDDDDEDAEDDHDPDASETIHDSSVAGTTFGAQMLRYRGFSTSISSLWLDESLVCASIGCFGLLLSQRTEFLLNVRLRQTNMQVKGKSAHRHPSRVVAYTLLMTIILITGTYAIFGFGNGNTYSSSQSGTDVWEDDGQVYYQNNDDDGRYVDGAADNAADDAADDAADAANDAADDAAAANDDQYYNANDDNRRQELRHLNLGLSEQQLQLRQQTHYFSPQQHRIQRYVNAPGYYKIQDYQHDVVEPFFSFLDHEWNRPHLQQTFRDLASSSSKSSKSDTGATIRFVLGLLFLLILGVVGRRRRMRTRYALVRARYQEDMLYSASTMHRSKLKESMEDNYEGACSHTLCGCYPVDPTKEEEDELHGNGMLNDNDTVVHDSYKMAEGKTKRRHEDCLSRGFSCLMATCCGVVCKCWFQCFSICALAQEAREVRLLVSPKFQRIDYMTHQPFSEYQVSVNDLRRGWLGKTRRKAGLLPHIQALSRLARYILITFFALLVLLSATLMFNPRASFSWPDLVVLIATFVQAFMVLYIIHWIFHKSDLSLDAVVKFFAAGFVVAVPSAFFMEGLLVNVFLAITYSVYALLQWIRGDVFVAWVTDHYRLLWIIGELVNAYIVAAVTEELCKYYTFRAVEHPDLIFLTGLNRNRLNSGQAYDGGLVQYPYGSHQVSQLNRSNSFESVSSQKTTKSETQAWIDRATTEDEFFEDDNDVRTHRQKAAALTTGMISVAVGLACAENFLYVFLLGGSGNVDDSSQSGIKEEWIVLFFRSIFPVHALAAAMQSIHMIRKFVECTGDAKDHRIGVGRIILPAVLLHGSFDAVLLGINVYVESAWDSYLEANDGVVAEGAVVYNAVVVNIVAWMSITMIMVTGILWYFREHRNQKMRLKVLEQEVMTSEGRTFSPGKAPTSEVELV